MGLWRIQPIEARRPETPLPRADAASGRTRRLLAAGLLALAASVLSAARDPAATASAGPADRAGGAAALPPQLPVKRLRLDSAASRVWFDGTSTFGAFTATTASLDGWAELPSDHVLAGAHGEVNVRAATLRTGIGLRDRHLREELDTDQYPLITVVVSRVAPPALSATAAGATPVLLEGTLTVKGHAHPVTFEATADFHDDTLVVAGRAPLRFTDLGMKPPSKLFGSVRVHDDFVLRFEGHFLPAAS